MDDFGPQKQHAAAEGQGGDPGAPEAAAGSEVPPEAPTEAGVSRPRGGHEDGAQAQRVAEAPPSAAAHECCAIVGVGASAGGLEAMQKLLEAMPADSGMCFVLVQHLDPTQESHLAEVLSRHTPMQVVQITDGQRIEPDHVYVIRPGSSLTLREGRLHLGEFAEPRGHRKPVDTFFRSLAEDQGERAIGIVLSGTGSNGSLGLRDVKARGGMVIAQDPAEAKFDGMPRSCINAGLADFILPVAKMPETLLRYVRHPYLQEDGRDQAVELTVHEPDVCGMILELLRRRHGHDFKHYKRPTLLRRIQRRMGLKFVTDMREYLAILHDDPEECAALASELFIKVTGFFRDPEAWDVLQREVIDPLIERAEPDQPIRAWAAGCASGEEAYSIAMLLMERAEAAGKPVRVRVFATDPSESLEFGRAGTYPASISADVPAARLQRFFEKDDAVYRVTRELRDVVTFAPHDLLRDPPFSRLDLVTCRNLLIYIEPQMQSKLLDLFHFALRDGGGLFLGSAETIGRRLDMFQPISDRWRIFRRIGPSRHDRLDFSLAGARRDPPAQHVSQHAAPVTAQRPPSLPTLAERDLLRRFAPVAALVNEQCRVLYVHGRADPWLAVPHGEMTGDLLAMARRGLRGPLRTIISKAARQGEQVVAEAQVRRGETLHTVTLTASPMQDPLTGEGLVLVTFKDVPEAQPVAAEAPDRGGPQGQRLLEEELRATRDELHATIAQLEATNEEYRASSEEMTSINEELQSTNEELETSREELQSLNEELSSVNAQLQSRVEDLEHANNDLHNLLSATDIATMFLDTDLRIRWFSPAMTRLLNVIPSDIGRPVGDLAQKVRGADLQGVARKVLETLVPIQDEVEDAEGRFFLHRTLPYRTGDNRINGAVVTFTDITERRQMEQRLRDALDYAEKIVDTVHEPFLVLDSDLRVVSVNSAFTEVFKVAAENLRGRLVYEIGGGEWDIPALRRLLERILPEDEKMEDFEVAQSFAGLGRRTMLLNARRVDHVQFVLLAIEDVTERRRAQEDQQVLLRELTHRVKNALTTAQAIALHSARSVDSLDQFIESFEGRLRSMAKAYDLLSQRRWEGIELRQLLEVELAPYSSEGNCQMSGPAAPLPAEPALAMQLVLHELATNAAKYGALSTGEGRLRVRWDIEPGADGKNMLWVRWVERGGPETTAPEKPGFGTELIATTVEHDLGGEYEATYASRGFRCEITVPWKKAPAGEASAS